MARNTAVLCLAVALLAVFTGNAAAIIGKGGHGKVGGGISLTVPKLSFETSCKDVCGDKCSLSPKKTCSDVSVPYQECKAVPETTTVKSCKKVCTTVTETPAKTETPVATKSSGKSLPAISLGKGRHLMGKGLPMISFGKGGFGKGSSSQSCKDECADVPVTKNTIKCESKTKTVESCSISFEKSCSKVCRQVCYKMPKVSHEQISIGKGEPISIGKGKGL